MLVTSAACFDEGDLVLEDRSAQGANIPSSIKKLDVQRLFAILFPLRFDSQDDDEAQNDQDKQENDFAPCGLLLISSCLRIISVERPQYRSIYLQQ